MGESRERVRAALRALGPGAAAASASPSTSSPADLAKEGSHYDLPIALALLAAMGVIATESLSGLVALGELALDGSHRAGRRACCRRRSYAARAAAA